MKKLNIFLLIMVSFSFLSCMSKKTKDQILNNNYELGNKIILDKSIYGAEIEISGNINKDNLIFDKNLMTIVSKGKDSTFIALVSKDKVIESGATLISTKDESPLNYKINKIINEDSKSNKQISKSISGFDNTENYSFLGDFNGDGEIAIDDFMEFSKYYGKNVYDANLASKLDIFPASKGMGYGWENVYVQSAGDKDGLVDIFDFYIFANNYGKKIPINHFINQNRLNIDLKVRTFDDNNNEIINLLINWGDGTEDTFNSTDRYLGELDYSHTYSEAKEYTIVITMTNSENNTIEKKIKVDAVDEDKIYFDDVNFENAIKQALGISLNSFVYPKDAGKVTQLDLSGKEISSLRGINEFINLESLNISGNYIEDIIFINSLTHLKSLNLSNNLLKSENLVNTLNSLVNLEVLDISNNKDIGILDNLSMFKLNELNVKNTGISNIDFVNGNTNLSKLNASFNEIQDLEPIKNLVGLKKLNLEGTSVLSLEAIKDLMLEELNIMGIEGILTTENTTILNTLETKGCVIVKDLPVSTLVTFKDKALEDRVRLALDKQIGDITKEEVSQITELNLTNYYSGKIQDLSGLENFTGLKNLFLNNNDIKDLSVLKNLKNLEQLDLSNNINLVNLDGLMDLPLKNLALINTGIDDISVLDRITSLTNVDLRYNNKLIIREGITNFDIVNSLINRGVFVEYDETFVYNVYFLDTAFEEAVRKALGKMEGDITNEDLMTIKKLDLSNVGVIEYLDGIQYMTNLEELNLSGNFFLEDISLLRWLNNLKNLNVSNTKVRDITSLKYLSNLNTIDLSTTSIGSIAPLININFIESLLLYDTIDLDKESADFIEDADKLRNKGTNIFIKREDLNEN